MDTNQCEVEELFTEPMSDQSLYKNSSSFSQKHVALLFLKQPASFGVTERTRECLSVWIHRFSSDDISLYLCDAGSRGLLVLQLPLQAARFWG